MVITRSRTGSNMLISLLNSHPEIIAKGELLARLKGGSHEEILRTKLIPRRRTRAIGFKLFYYHPMDHGREEVWESLVSDPALRIIHLKRRNVLRTCVSRAIAEKQDVWKERTTEVKATAREKAVHLSYDELVEAFQKTREWEEHTDRLFSGHPRLEVVYEQMAQTPVPTFSRVAAFLGVQDHTPSTDLVKQNPEPLSQLILNYEELRTRFEGTPWEVYFEE
ncbi:MAG TPA: Stf0 family sulfotransferase [Pseudomonadales bacterium]